MYIKVSRLGLRTGMRSLPLILIQASNVAEKWGKIAHPSCEDSSTTWTMGTKRNTEVEMRDPGTNDWVLTVKQSH